MSQPTRRSKRLVLSVIALAILSVLVIFAAPTQSLPAEGFKLSDASPKAHKEYGPIAGNDPTAQALVPTASNCRDLPGNAFVPIEMDFEKDFGSILEVVVNWEPAEANDIDIYFFDEGGEVIADSTSASSRESVRLGSLANGQYHLCVRSFSGPNAGFAVDASVRFVTLFERTPEPPTAAPFPSPRTSAETTPQPGAGGLKPIAAPTAEAVDTPGPDGPFSERGLVTVASGKQADPDEGGLSVVQLVFIGLTGLIAVGGTGLVVFRIRRDMKG